MFSPKPNTPTGSNINVGSMDRSYTSASAKAIAVAAARRRSSGTFATGRKRLSIGTCRSTPLNRSIQTSQIVECSGQYNVDSYGTSLPALVMEALTFADKNAELSAILSPSGWAWLVAGRRLLIWKYRMETSRRNTNHQFRELTLPPSDLAHRAQLVVVFSHTEGQIPSCVAVSPEGFVRYWPNITHEGSYFEVSTELQGQECDSLLFLNSSLGCLLATTTSTVLLIQLNATASGSATNINVRQLKMPAGIFGGISRRVSSLVFGSMPVQAPEARFVGMVPIDESESETTIVVLSARSLQKWVLGTGCPDKLIYECNIEQLIHDTYIRTVWSRESIGGSQVRIWLLAMQLNSNETSVTVLTAAVNSSLSQQLIYAFANIDIIEEEAPFAINKFCLLQHSEYYQESAESLILAHRFILSGNNAYIYNRCSVLCASALYSDMWGSTVDRIEFSTGGDNILGAGRSHNSGLFFSSVHGIVSVSPSAGLNQTNTLPNESFMEDTIDLTNLTNLGKLCDTNSNDACSKLEAAVIQFTKKNLKQSQAIIEELFPSSESAELNKTVAQLSTKFIDDIPAMDPRWAEVGEKQHAQIQHGSSTTSLLIVNQINDKITAHQIFVLFLQQTGLWPRLSSTFLQNRTINVRTALIEDSEKLAFAASLRNQHSGHQALVDSAIRAVLEDRKEKPSGRLQNSDVFYRRVSQISSIVWGLVQAQDEVLSADLTPRDAALTICNVNSIILTLLKAVREVTFSAGRASSNIDTDCEYVPWVSSEGPKGMRDMLSIQHQTTVKTGLVRAEDSTIRGKLYSQLVELTDEYLTGFQPHLSSLASTNHPRHKSMLESYQKQRYATIQPLVKGEQFNQAVNLAEKFCDFRTLIEVCDETDNQQRLNQYMTQFSSQGFSDFVFRWYLETGKRGKLLNHCGADLVGNDLTRFLKDYSTLAWIHQMNSRDFQAAHETLKHLAIEETSYFSRKKTLLSLSKLSRIAACQNEEEVDLDEVLLQEEDLLMYQEQLPEPVLTTNAINADTMRVFNPLELIQLYISSENTYANEFDYKKALDLLSWIENEDEIKEMKRNIWVAAILKNDWESLDTNEPIEALKETVFFKTVELSFMQGCDVMELLVPVEDLIEAEAFSDLRKNSTFPFLIKAGYEKINEIVCSD